MEQTNLKKSFIWWGEIGIWQTLFAMRELAQASILSPHFCDFVDNQVLSTRDSVLDQLSNYVKGRVHFVDDPEGYEYVKDPILMMSEIQKEGFASGDCDDHVTFLSALLTCKKIPNAMIALELPQLSDGFNHVVNGIPMGNGIYYILDCSMKEGKVEYDIKNSLKVDVL